VKIPSAQQFYLERYVASFLPDFSDGAPWVSIALRQMHIIFRPCIRNLNLRMCGPVTSAQSQIYSVIVSMPPVTVYTVLEYRNLTY